MSWAPQKHREGYPLNFQVRVSQKKGEVAIWGGSGVATALTGTDGYLVVRVDERGEEVEIKKKAVQVQPAQVVCTLKPGESFVIGIDNAVAITASCATDSFVDCALVFRDA